jgi:putative component of toxin-antitoxin plasmid stabilization module
MPEVIYFTRKNGSQPAKEWIDSPKNSSIRPSVDAKIQRLEIDELQSLINRKIVVPIKPDKRGNNIPGLYELRYVSSPGWRIPFYHDRSIDTYVLLCGFRKTKDVQKKDIDNARSLAYEYLAIKNEGK